MDNDPEEEFVEVDVLPRSVELESQDKDAVVLNRVSALGLSAGENTYSPVSVQVSSHVTGDENPTFSS